MTTAKTILLNAAIRPANTLFAVKTIKEKEMYATTIPCVHFRKGYVSETELAKAILVTREEERTRFGQDLHDSVNPLLCIARIYMNLIKADTKKNRTSKEQVCRALSEAVENIRTISSRLVAAHKPDYDLFQLVTELTNNISGAGLFTIDVILTHRKKIAALCCEKKVALYRTIQEQINNTSKYSKARQVQLRLFCRNGFVQLIIKDDGIGFNNSKQRNGIGLANIEKRVSQHQGKIKITTAPGKGCCMHVLLPL